MESDVVNTNIQEFSLKKLLSDCLNDFKISLSSTQKINLIECEIIDLISSDQHILKNILMNLLSNALKYSKDDIDINFEEKGDNFSLTIRDRGISISKKEQQMLFDQFFRAENTVNIHGNGLDLNIVLHYMGLLGGTITFKSEEGISSEFTISFPIIK